MCGCVSLRDATHTFAVSDGASAPHPEMCASGGEINVFAVVMSVEVMVQRCRVTSHVREIQRVADD